MTSSRIRGHHRMPIRIHTALLKLLGIVVLGIVTTPFLFAKDVVVDCSGATPRAFTSINAALSTLNAQRENSVAITGTCTEDISIVGFQKLSLRGSGTAVIKPRGSRNITLSLSHSNVSVMGPLVFDAGEIDIQENSELSLSNVTIQNSPQDGIFSVDSLLFIANSTIENNAAEGIFLQDSHADIAASTITNNRGDGIQADHAHIQLHSRPGTTISNNTAIGIWLTEGSTALISGDNHIHGNGSGVTVSVNSNIFMLNGEILNNQSVGVAIGSGSQGNFLSSKINGNTQGGMSVGSSSSVLLQSADINGNGADGIFVEDGGQLVTEGGSSINNNVGDGVELKAMALAHFRGTNNTIIGNGKFSVQCDDTSLVEADVSGLANVSCSRIAPR